MSPKFLTRLVFLLLMVAALPLRAQTDGSRRWAFTTGGLIVSSPAEGPNGAIYFGSQDKYIYSLTAAGVLRWRFLTGDWVDSTPAIDASGTVYAGSWDGKLYALNPNGTKKWEYATNAFIASSPAIGADGTVYVGSGDFNLHAVNPDGTGKWTFLTGDWIDSAPAIGGDGTIYVGSWDGSLYAIDPNGQLRWSFATGGDVTSSPAIGADGTVYVGSRDHKLYALSPAGAKLWEFATGDSIEGSPVVGADGSVYVASRDGRLYALTSAGVLRWMYAASTDLVSTPAIRGTSLVVGTSDNSIVCLNLANGAVLWTAPTGDWVDSAPLVTSNGTIDAGCYDQKRYSLNGNGQALASNAPWPALHRDAQRQGRAPGSPPSITTQPVAQSVAAGSAVTLSVSAAGTPPLTYQWYRNSVALSGAVSSVYSLASATSLDAGSYQVTVGNAFGNATSSAVTLSVSLLAQSINFAPLTNQPMGAGPLSLTATATSGLPVAFSLVSGPALLTGNLLSLTGTGSVVVRAAQAGNEIYAAAPNVDRNFIVTMNFATWQQLHFTTGELADPAVSGPGAILGLDGLSNLLKFSVGLDPKQDVTQGLPVLSCDGTDWIYCYTRPSIIGGVSYAVQVSTDLAVWTTDGVTHERVAVNGDSETWQGRFPANFATRVYLRLQVTLP